MHRGKYLSAILVMTVTFWSPPAASADIYQWIDDDGVVHFSDTRPNTDAAVKTLQVNTSNPPGYDPTEDPYSIANQAKRMNARWSELAEEREEREEQRRESARQYAQNRPPRYDGWRYSYWPGYYTPVRPVQPPPRQLRTINRQVSAMESLNLSGPRPHSINSGAHHARVESRNNFLSSVTNPAPR